MAHARKTMPSSLSLWADDMKHEFQYIEGGLEALSWAAGCVIATYIERGGRKMGKSFGAIVPFLRIVAVFLALCVFLVLFQTIDGLLRGGIGTLVPSGTFGAATILHAATTLGCLLILIVGPFASVQLWRLRRVGLYAASILSGFLTVYYFAGLLFLRAHDVVFMPILAYVVFNGVLVVLLASPAARRSCT